MHSCWSDFGPDVTMPSNRSLSTFLLFLAVTGFLAFALAADSPFVSNLPHGAHSNPPSGPVLLYGVTVKRFPHVSQFSSCPGMGLDFLYILSITSS